MKYEVEKKIEIMGQFSELFCGGLWYDCGRGGKLTYSIKDKEDITKKRYFDASFLEESEAIALMETSIKDGVNYLYEKVKDYEYIPYYEPDCLY